MRSHTTPRRALVALGVAIGSFAILQSLLVPVLPLMQRDLRTDAPGITWALTLYLIVAAVATPLAGRAGDLLGKRRVLLAALAAVGLGSLVAAVAPNLPVLLTGRALQGLGGAMIPLAFGLVRDVLPAERVAGGVGALAAIIAVGSGLGTVLAGPLSGAIGWRGLFVLPLAGVVVGGWLVLRAVPDGAAAARGRLNAVAGVLLSAWLLALLLPLSSGESWGWGSARTVGLLVAAGVLAAAWVVVELRAREPLVDVRMMRLPGVWNTNVAAVLIGAAMYGVWAYFARFLQEPTSTGYGLGAGVGTAGLLMLPMLALMAAAGFATGPLGRVLAPRAQLAGGSVLIAAATAAIALFHRSAPLLSAEAAVFGLGLGVAFAAMTTIVVTSVPADRTGVASGMNTNLRTIGSAVGTALTTAIVTGSATAPGGEPTEHGYTVGFLVLAVVAALAAVVAVASRASRGGSDAGVASLPATEALEEVAVGSAA